MYGQSFRATSDMPEATLALGGQLKTCIHFSPTFLWPLRSLQNWMLTNLLQCTPWLARYLASMPTGHCKPLISNTWHTVNAGVRKLFAWCMHLSSDDCRRISGSLAVLYLLVYEMPNAVVPLQHGCKCEHTMALAVALEKATMETSMWKKNLQRCASCFCIERCSLCSDN